MRQLSGRHSGRFDEHVHFVFFEPNDPSELVSGDLPLVDEFV